MIKKKYVGVIAITLMITGAAGLFITKKKSPEKKTDIIAEYNEKKEISVLAYKVDIDKNSHILINDLVEKKINEKEINENSKYIKLSQLGSLKDRRLFLKHSVIAGNYIHEEDFYQPEDTKYMELLAGEKNKMMFPLLFNLPKDFNKTGGVYDGLNNEEIRNFDIGDLVNIYSRVKYDDFSQKKNRIKPVEIKASEILGIKRNEKDKGAVLYLAINKEDYAKIMIMMSSDLYVSKCPVIKGKYDCSFDMKFRKFEKINEIRG